MNFKPVAPVAFPEFRGINVNMMPFVMGDSGSLPSYLHHYAPLISACPLPADQLGHVGYLTVDERIVEHDTSHRRAGLHTEGFGDASWGGGGWGGTGGLFLASTRPDSCRLYDASVLVSGPLGQVAPEQVVGAPAENMRPDTLYWLHDRVPHESVPISAGPRQFFRLVTKEVSRWYAQHSTPNPLGVAPQAAVVTGSKFH